MPAVVIDASFAVALLLPDEAKPPVSMTDLFEEEGAVVPTLWPFEVANTLLVAERRRRIPPSSLDGILADFAALPIVLDDEPVLRSWAASIELAMRHRLTVYDAAYLELARRLRLPLATLDGDLRKAARAEGLVA